MAKRIYCAWCGEFLYEGDSDPRDYESCGNAECNREVNGMHRQDREEAAYEAERDDYERYRR